VTAVATKETGLEVRHDDAALGRASRPRGRRRLGPGRAIPFGYLIGPLLLLGVWSWGSAAGWIDPRVLTAPWTVVTTAQDLWETGRLGPDLLVSTRWGEAIVDGPVQLKRSIPNLALLPLLLLWFGIDERMKIITIALGVLIPIYIHTHNGLRSIDGRYAELAETLRLGPGAFITRVVLPGALPGFFLGLRFAVTASWLSLVVVEQVNATSGIGYMMLLAGTYGQTDVIVVGLVLYGLLGLASDLLVRLVQRKALSWRRTLED
jgi:sulfonate transport system permease protein